MFKHFRQGIVIIRSAWMRQLNFRFSVTMYRIGEIAELLALIFMWTAIYAGGSGAIKGFSLPEMITYVLIGSLCSTITRNYLPSYISRDISEGKLSMFLVKPIPYIKFIFFNELGRASLSVFISVATQLVVISFFHGRLIFNNDPAYISLMILMIFLAYIIEWLIGFMVGLIAFWTDEVDGVYSTIDRLKRFFAGGYFPLSLLPPVAATLSTFLPFAYSFFVPAQLYLKKIDIHAGFLGITVQLVWIAILSILLGIVWKMGLKKYEATGS